ncbi:MAG: GNAT family N-acetyltransferase [Spirochaetota bacterium]
MTKARFPVQEILALYDEHERINASFPHFRRQAGAHTVRLVDEGGGAGVVVYSRLDERIADSAIQEEVEYFKRLGVGFEWKLYSHDRPGDLKERLAGHGFSIGEEEAVMALDLSRLPGELAAPPAVDIRRLGGEAGFEDFFALNKTLWPGDEGLEDWLKALKKTALEEPDRVGVYVAYVDGKPVCSARIDLPPSSPFASLWGGATLPEYRRRGIYTAVLALRAQEAIARGYRFLTIDASPMSRPIVARLGFSLLSLTYPCEWQPPASP